MREEFQKCIETRELGGSGGSQKKEDQKLLNVRKCLETFERTICL